MSKNGTQLLAMLIYKFCHLTKVDALFLFFNEEEEKGKKVTLNCTARCLFNSTQKNYYSQWKSYDFFKLYHSKNINTTLDTLFSYLKMLKAT